jgi:DNA-binding response OmpR family regulator
VVDDESLVRGVLRRALTSLGYQVITVAGGAQAIEALLEQPPDLIVLDVAMPGVDGLEVCRYLRSQQRLAHIPCLLLTGRADLADKAEGFGAGADDYVTKPFELTELDLKIRALLRRARAHAPSPIATAGALELHLETRQAKVNGQPVDLSRVEFDLLSALVQAAGSVVSSETLLASVWGYPPGTGNRGLVRMHVLNVRRKIEQDPSHPQHILTVPRHGYKVAC